MTNKLEKTLDKIKRIISTIDNEELNQKIKKYKNNFTTAKIKIIFEEEEE